MLNNYAPMVGIGGSRGGRKKKAHYTMVQPLLLWWVDPVSSPRGKGVEDHHVPTPPAKLRVAFS